MKKDTLQFLSEHTDSETLSQLVEYVLYGDINAAPWVFLKKHLKPSKGKTVEETYSTFINGITEENVQQQTRVSIAACLARIIAIQNSQKNST